MTRAAKGSERTPTPLPEFLPTQKRSAPQAIVAMSNAGAYRLASLVSPSLTRPAIVAFDPPAAGKMVSATPVAATH